MKKLLIAFCCVFTVVTLFCSFNEPIEIYKRATISNIDPPYAKYYFSVVDLDGQHYVVVQGTNGVGICKK